jgi:hypothetical protein
MKHTLRISHQLLAKITTIVVLLHAATAAYAAQFVYDLTDDWSTTQNPNGVWSYNQGSSPISVFQEFWWGESGWGYLWIGDGCIIKGNQPTGIDPWSSPVLPAHDWKPGDVMMHALSIPYGGETTFLNVTWTSPADGTIDITGRAWDGGIAVFPDRDVRWSLIVAGRPVAQRASVRELYRKDKGAKFSDNLTGESGLANIPIAKGEVVEFRVVTDTYYGQFVGVQEKITLKTRKP